jgi:hypothetical protein
VSAPDWNIYSSYLKYLDELKDESADEWLGSVLFVWAKVYTLAKVIVMIFIHYGVEVCSPSPPIGDRLLIALFSWKAPPIAS